MHWLSHMKSEREMSITTLNNNHNYLMKKIIYIYIKRNETLPFDFRCVNLLLFFKID